MYTDKKWRCDKKIATWIEHLYTFFPALYGHNKCSNTWSARIRSNWSAR